MKRRATGLSVIAGLLAAAAVLVALPSTALGSAARGSASASNSQTFQDSTGENPAAPDITAITVSNDDAGNITMQVNIPNRPTFTPDMLMLVFLNTDNNASTGDPQDFGADYVLQLIAGSVNLFPWTGSDFGNAVQTSALTYSYTNGVASFHLSDTDIGHAKVLAFGIVVESGLTFDETGALVDTNAVFDLAPDPGHGTYQYQVLTTLKLSVSAFTTSPKPAKAGKPFSAGLAVNENDTDGPVKTGTVTCTATVAGKHIPAAHKGTVVNGIATCVWPLPKKDKGKTIRGTITLTVKATTVQRSFSAKIT